MKEETKQEMTAEEFKEKWGEWILCFKHGEELLADLRSVIRGKTVEKSNAVVEIFKKNRFDKDHHLGMGDIRLTVAQQDAILDLFPFKDNSLPPAEGAEEIIASIVESLGEPINIHNHIFEIRPYTVEHKTEWWIFHKEVGSGEPLTQWLSKFATLHAQKIADKMVGERLREQKAFTDWCINHVEIESREEKYIIDNETTIYSFSDLLDYWNRYLKSRDSHE